MKEKDAGQRVRSRGSRGERYRHEDEERGKERRKQRKRQGRNAREVERRIQKRERLQDDKCKEEYLGRISSKRRWKEGEKGAERGQHSFRSRPETVGAKMGWTESKGETDLCPLWGWLGNKTDFINTDSKIMFSYCPVHPPMATDAIKPSKLQWRKSRTLKQRWCSERQRWNSFPTSLPCACWAWVQSINTFSAGVAFVLQRNLCIRWEGLSVLRLTRQDLVFLSLPWGPDGTSKHITIVPPRGLIDSWRPGGKARSGMGGESQRIPRPRSCRKRSFFSQLSWNVISSWSYSLIPQYKESHHVFPVHPFSPYN